MAGFIQHSRVCPGVQTIAASNANQITKEYYDFLVGQINRGVIKKAVCSLYYPDYGHTTYHLIG